MRKLTIIVFALFVSSVFCAPSFARDTAPEIIVRAETPEEATGWILDYLERLPWFEKNKYQLSFPKDPFIDYLSKKQKFSTADRDKLYKLMSSKIYNEKDYEAGLKILNLQDAKIKKAAARIVKLSKKWGFKNSMSYEVVLTLYGPGGNTDNDKNQIAMLTRPDGTFKINDPVDTIIHELMHIVVEPNIVDVYKLSHWEKEGLVDALCQRYFKDIVFNYHIQKRADKNIIDFLKGKNLNDMKKVIEDYVAAYPRQTKS